MLCDQKSFGSSPRRAIAQSFTTDFHVLPASVEHSIWYLMSDAGGFPEATCPTAYNSTPGSPRGVAISSVTCGVLNPPATMRALACARFGPAETIARPEDSNETVVPFSFRRGRTPIAAWQTVRISMPALPSVLALALKRIQYWRWPFARSVKSNSPFNPTGLDQVAP